MMAPAPPGSLEAQCWQQLITQLRSAAGLPDLPGTAPAAPPIPQDDDALWTYVHDTWGVAIPRYSNEAQAPTAEMAVTPPSIRKSAPTTYAESSDAR